MRTISKDIIKQLSGFIHEAENIVLITHKNPDGDAIGSSLGMYHYLKSNKKNATVIVPNDYPHFLKWLPGSNSVIDFETNKLTVEKILANTDLILFLDFNVTNRLHLLEEPAKTCRCKKVLIDHHPDPEDFADITISDTSVSSTAELVYHVIAAMENKNFINREISECLYTGIMTDTGAFNYNSSHADTYHTVAKLLSAEIDKEKIHDSVYNNYSADRMRLLGYCLNEKLKVIPEFNAAYISLTQEELVKYNFVSGDSEGFVNYPLSIQGIRFSAIFIEHPDYVKISFRSKGNFPANKFSAENFNGGGHLNAAGGESNLSLQSTLSKFEQLLPQYKKYMTDEE